MANALTIEQALASSNHAICAASKDHRLYHHHPITASVQQAQTKAAAPSLT